MGGVFSRNLVVPQQQLSVVAANAAAQDAKARKNKRHKFNTLVVPDPQSPNFASHSTPGTSIVAWTSTINELPSRASLRVQFLKAVKRGDVEEMASLLLQYQQPRSQSPEPHEDENEDAGNDELVNIRGMWESTPLISATQYGHSEAALWLLSHGAHPYSRNEKEVTALLLASLEGLVPVVERLLEAAKVLPEAISIDDQVGVVYNATADVNVRLSPLLAACMNGHKEIARRLLNHGVNVNQQLFTSGSLASSGSTALLLAARYGHASVVALLLKRGADYTLLDGATDASALVLACEYGHETCALAILNTIILGRERSSIDSEAEIWQAPNRQGFTCLHFAAANGLLATCETILVALKHLQQSLEDEVMAIAFVNARAGARRENALLLAVRKRQYDTARLLLEAGADAELADRGGNTAMQILTRTKQEALLRLCQVAASTKSHRQLSTDTLMTAADAKKEEELRGTESHVHTRAVVDTTCVPDDEK